MAHLHSLACAVVRQDSELGFRKRSIPEFSPKKQQQQQHLFFFDLCTHEFCRRAESFSGMPQFLMTMSDLSKAGFYSSRYQAKMPLHPGDMMPVFTCVLKPIGVSELVGMQIRGAVYMTDQEPIYFRATFNFNDFDPGKIVVAEQLDDEYVEDIRSFHPV